MIEKHTPLNAQFFKSTYSVSYSNNFCNFPIVSSFRPVLKQVILKNILNKNIKIKGHVCYQNDSIKYVVGYSKKNTIKYKNSCPNGFNFDSLITPLDFYILLRLTGVVQYRINSYLKEKNRGKKAQLSLLDFATENQDKFNELRTIKFCSFYQIATCLELPTTNQKYFITIKIALFKLQFLCVYFNGNYYDSQKKKRISNLRVIQILSNTVNTNQNNKNIKVVFSRSWLQAHSSYYQIVDFKTIRNCNNSAYLINICLWLLSRQEKMLFDEEVRNISIQYLCQLLGIDTTKPAWQYTRELKRVFVLYNKIFDGGFQFEFTKKNQFVNICYKKHIEINKKKSNKLKRDQSGEVDNGVGSVI